MLDTDSAIPDSDPFAQFDLWFSEARASEPNDAMRWRSPPPRRARCPLCGWCCSRGMGRTASCFTPNAHSRKGGEILANPQAALLFHWKSLRRQIRIEGPLSEVSAAEADAYFHSRPFVSQVGSAASDQSRPLDSRATYTSRVDALAAEFAAAGEVPRPRIGPGSA